MGVRRVDREVRDVKVNALIDGVDVAIEGNHSTRNDRTEELMKIAMDIADDGRNGVRSGGVDVLGPDVARPELRNERDGFVLGDVGDVASTHRFGWMKK